MYGAPGLGERLAELIRRHNQTVMPMESRAWHSKTSDVYHISQECTEGNNIEAENLRPGRGGKVLCKKCRELVLANAYR